jgi:hypothetical protein
MQEPTKDNSKGNTFSSLVHKIANAGKVVVPKKRKPTQSNSREEITTKTTNNTTQ